jgi:hypothetical protein
MGDVSMANGMSAIQKLTAGATFLLEPCRKAKTSQRGAMLSALEDEGPFIVAAAA